jgi:hypothetical protein
MQVRVCVVIYPKNGYTAYYSSDCGDKQNLQEIKEMCNLRDNVQYYFVEVEIPRKYDEGTIRDCG